MINSVQTSSLPGFVQVGPQNPFKTKQQLAPKNMLSGYVEPAHFDNFQFENQRRTFHSFGMTLHSGTLHKSQCSKTVDWCTIKVVGKHTEEGFCLGFTLTALLGTRWRPKVVEAWVLNDGGLTIIEPPIQAVPNTREKIALFASMQDPSLIACPKHCSSM